MRIVLIGSGNTATVLGRLLKAAGHNVYGVYSKTVQHAQQLAVELNAQHSGSIEAVSLRGDFYIVAVKDDKIPQVANTLNLQGKTVVHTSGAVAASVLAPCSADYGVLYPLQSLRKEAVREPVIPFLIDGCNNNIKQQVRDIAESISSIVTEADDEKRLAMHVAAVIVSNFTNHLYTLAEDFCNKEHLPFKALVPLIQEVAERTTQYSPATMQTGPAIRNDAATIEKHISLLEGFPALQKMYAEITDSIMKFYKK